MGKNRLESGKISYGGSSENEGHPTCDHCDRINTKSKGKIRGLARSKHAPGMMLCSRCYNRARVDGKLPDLNKSKARKRTVPVKRQTTITPAPRKRRKLESSDSDVNSDDMKTSFGPSDFEKDLSTSEEEEEDESQASTAEMTPLALSRPKRERKQRRQSLDEQQDSDDDGGWEWTPEGSKPVLKIRLPVKTKVSEPIEPPKPIKSEVIAELEQPLGEIDPNELGWAEEEAKYDELWNFFKGLEPWTLEPFMKFLVAEGWASGSGNEMEVNVTKIPFDVLVKVLAISKLAKTKHDYSLKQLSAELNDQLIKNNILNVDTLTI